MKYIELFEQWIPKLSNEPVPISKVGSFGQRITDTGKKKIKKQDLIVATDDTIKQIVRDEIKRLGKDADLNHIDVSQVTNMNKLFWDIEFQGDVSEWNVSKVTNMSELFYDCENFNCDLSTWDVSNVTNMDKMFYNCKNFNNDISSWDVSNVNDMNYMFHCCYNFNQDLSNWNVSSVIYMGGMFYKCSIKDEYKPKFK